VKGGGPIYSVVHAVPKAYANLNPPKLPFPWGDFDPI